MSAAGHVDGIEVLWRPGCPFCSSLRRGLRRRAIVTTEINIWDDPGAAERVR
ncbi:MAG: NrdH-redoxin, partial [Actinomycetia bacterium]|nr:NrdH-redoxin [Actinomycetes bacterium]